MPNILSIMPLIALLGGCYCHLISSSKFSCQIVFEGLIPVIHNLDCIDVDKIANTLSYRHCASVSLRHPGAMEALHKLKNKLQGSSCKLGASSVVSESQIKDLSTMGIDFVSTMHYADALVNQSNQLKMPMMCGCGSLIEADAAIKGGVHALKFFPSKTIRPAALGSIMANLESSQKGSKHGIRNGIIVAGGVEESDMEAYFNNYATGFAIGFDGRKPQELHSRLNHLDKVMAFLRAKHPFL